MIFPLKNIASIHTGLFAKPSSEGQIVYLQAKHFKENGSLAAELFPDLQSEKSVERHLLQPGDVLFAAKGSKNFATTFEQHNLPAVASTSFFVIRITKGNIIPQYLAWYLNHSYTMEFLKGKAIGTKIVSISKNVLLDLQIPVPEFQKQKTILNVHALKQQETNLKQRLEILKNKYTEHFLLKSVQDK